jgi:hypothetical protein
MYSGWDNDERVDFEIGELEIDIDTVESDNKVDEDILRFGRDLGKKFLLKGGE